MRKSRKRVLAFHTTWVTHTHAQAHTHNTDVEKPNGQPGWIYYCTIILGLLWNSYRVCFAGCADVRWATIPCRDRLAGPLSPTARPLLARAVSACWWKTVRMDGSADRSSRNGPIRMLWTPTTPWNRFFWPTPNCSCLNKAMVCGGVAAKYKPSPTKNPDLGEGCTRAFRQPHPAPGTCDQFTFIN